MFRIGPFSKLVMVSARMLRHYEKCGLFFPAEVDRESGYRLYSAGQIPLIRRIAALRDMGFTTHEIGLVLERGDDPAWLEETLRQRVQAIETEIAGQSRRLALVRDALQNGKENMRMANYKIEVKAVPAVRVISVRETLPSYYNEGDLWHKLYRFMNRNGYDSSGSCYTVYHDQEHKEQDVDVEVGLPWNEAASPDGADCAVRNLEAIPLAACITFEGPYEETGKATDHLAGWIEANGYEIVGISRSVGLKHPGNTDREQHYVTEIQFPVRRI